MINQFTSKSSKECDNKSDDNNVQVPHDCRQCEANYNTLKLSFGEANYKNQRRA